MHYLALPYTYAKSQPTGRQRQTTAQQLVIMTKLLHCIAFCHLVLQHHVSHLTMLSYPRRSTDNVQARILDVALQISLAHTHTQVWALFRGVLPSQQGCVEHMQVYTGMH